MKRIILVAMVAALLGGFALDLAAQTNVRFGTTINPSIIGSNTRVEIKGIIADPRNAPPLVDRRCYFALGFRYNPRVKPHVEPLIIFGAAPFMPVLTRQGPTLQASLRLAVGRLPRGLNIPFLVQAATLVKTRAGVKIWWAVPAKAVLKT